MRRQGFPAMLLLAFLGTLAAACSGPSSTAPARPEPAATPASAGPASRQADPPAGRPAEPTAALVKLTVPYTPIAGAMAPLWIGIDERLFEKHGLEVTGEFVGGSAPILQAILSGQYPIGLVGGGAPALSRLGGSDITIIGTHGKSFSIGAWAKPEIRAISDLKGRTIAVTRFSSASHFAAIAMLASAGLAPEDVAFLQSGGVSESLAMLLSGQVDAAMISPPASLEAERAGYPRLAALWELGDYGLFPEEAIVVREQWVQEPANRDLTLRFLRAFDEAMALARTDAEATKRALAKYTQVEDPALLQGTFEFYQQFFPPTLRVDERTVANMLRTLDQPGAKDADPRQFFDNSLVDAISR
jgi:NitT/TauT family transport system substrate-binding protein